MKKSTGRAKCPYCDKNYPNASDNFEGEWYFEAVWKCPHCDKFFVVCASMVDDYETKKIEGEE